MAILEAISKLLASRNKARGFSNAIETSAYERRLADRYKDADRVASAMFAKVRTEEDSLNELIDQLAMEEELKAAQMGQGESEYAATETRQEILNDFGYSSNYKERRKHLRGPQRTNNALAKISLK